MSEIDNLHDADGKNEIETDVTTPEEVLKSESKNSEPSEQKEAEVESETADAEVHAEIEASNAEDAEDESNAERHQVE